VKECLDSAVRDAMPAWYKFALSLTRNETNAKDLVSEALVKILENQREKAEELACENRLMSYVHRAIYLMAIDDSSRYGLLDTYIQLMPERDAILLRLYMLDGFDYKDLSDKTKIPIKRLYFYISNAIKKIRNDVHRTTRNS
jgi:DNA-directed RNA polymerase specialized sigma24 family protein